MSQHLMRSCCASQLTTATSANAENGRTCAFRSPSDPSLNKARDAPAAKVPENGRKFREGKLAFGDDFKV